MRMRRLQEDLKASNEQLSKLAVTDPLTGLLNRRGFYAHLDDELWRARRFGHSIGLVLFDLDHFKNVNDTWGHTQGDVVLKHFSDVLIKSSRRVDKVARLGGEEFALLLPSTDEGGVSIVAEKVRVATSELEIPLPGAQEGRAPIRVTVSGGAVILPQIEENDVEMAPLSAGLFEMADRCLYMAKQSGRNQIVTRLLNDVETAKIGAESHPTSLMAPPAAFEQQE
jgi:diguanylate cyclase (GGDEF)-like protein